MTYAKAVNALIDEGLMNEERTGAAITAQKGRAVKFTYPDWLEALATAVVLARLDVDEAADVMQEAEEGGEEFNQALRRTDVF